MSRSKISKHTKVSYSRKQVKKKPRYAVRFQLKQCVKVKPLCLV